MSKDLALRQYDQYKKGQRGGEEKEEEVVKMDVVDEEGAAAAEKATVDGKAALWRLEESMPQCASREETWPCPPRARSHSLLCQYLPLRLSG